MKATISKQLFLKGATCATLGWRLRSSQDPDDPSPEPALGEKLRMEMGAEIGRRARELFPEGVWVSNRALAKAVEETARLMQRGGPDAIFEASFLTDSYAAKADILTRLGDSWHLIEVKSNVNMDAKLLDDLAYTWMVLTRAGLSISRASLWLVSNDFRSDMDSSKLFAQHDCTDKIRDRQPAFDHLWEIVKKSSSASTMPEPILTAVCKSCAVFDDCLGKGIANHIFEIPYLSAKKLEALNGLGVYRIEAIPADFELTAIQGRVRQSVLTSTPWVAPGLKKALEAIKWPAHYLDFETMNTALPLFPDVAPYTQIVTQFSIHTCSATGNVRSHSEYLSKPTHDARRDLAERLIKDLEGDGTIVTYSNFEKTTINGLATLFPDLAAGLTGLIPRIFNLEALIRNHYYHPAFHGSYSVKTTLPALVPDMSYASLNIRDGDSASAVFAYMVLGRYTQDETTVLSRDLLTYCGQDTLAMVRLHERLLQLVSSQ